MRQGLTTNSRRCAAAYKVTVLWFKFDRFYLECDLAAGSYANVFEKSPA